MKKIMALLLSLILVCGLAACSKPASGDSPATTEQTAAANTGSDASKEETAGGKELTKLRVAVQPYYNGMQMAYILDKDLGTQYGLELEPILFSNGATANEALAADQWDVTLTGGAFVFGVANYGAKIVGSHINGTGGNELYVRADSPIASVKGYNPTYPDIYGSPETVKGAKIIIATGTTSQQCAVKWLEAIGVNEEDVELVNMDYATGYQAFLSGEADAVVLVSPYCYDAPAQGWVKAADLVNLHAANYEEIMCTAKAYEQMPDAIASFVALVYMANDALEADPALKLEYCMKWYADNANPVEESSAQAECDLKPLVTSQEAAGLELGVYEVDYAEFMVSVDKLDASQVDTVRSCMAQDILNAALEKLAQWTN